jgi:hypothetical protein
MIHALDAAGVVAELVALAKQLKHEHERGAQLGLREVAFYDVMCQNDALMGAHSSTMPGDSQLGQRRASGRGSRRHRDHPHHRR